jgi:putative endonuclease
LERRISQHGTRCRWHFACQYNADKLIYFESFSNPRTAIAREKQLKGWRRSKKEALIAVSNPEWRDLMTDMLAVE